MNVYFFICSFLSIVDVVACALLDTKYAAYTTTFAWLPALLIVLFGLITWKTNHGNATVMSWGGEQAYFLGYICTLSAVIGFLLRLQLSDGTIGKRILDNPKALVLMSIIALSTIIVGLIVMTLLKSAAQSLTDTQGLSKDHVALQKLVDTLENAGVQPTVKGLLDQMRVLQETSTDVKKILFDLSTTVEALNKTLNTFNNTVAGGNPKAAQFVENVQQTQNVLNDFVRLVKRKIDIENKEI